MWTRELATNTMTPDRRIGASSDVSGTMSTSCSGSWTIAGAAEPVRAVAGASCAASLVGRRPLRHPDLAPHREQGAGILLEPQLPFAHVPARVDDRDHRGVRDAAALLGAVGEP